MYHWYSSFPISLAGCPNFDPMHGKKWKEKRNSTYYLLLRSVCMEEQDAQEIMVYLSSTHLSHLILFVSLSAQWSWDGTWYNFWVFERNRREATITSSYARHLCAKSHRYLRGKCKWKMTLEKVKPWLFHTQSMFLSTLGGNPAQGFLSPLLF